MTTFNHAQDTYLAPPDWPATPDHADAGCPPNPDALCVCGDVLEAHIPTDPDSAPDVDWLCPDHYHLTWGQDGPRFQPVAGTDGDLGCPGVEVCNICDARICSEHSDEFASCAEGGLHHADCAGICIRCADVAAEDAAIERADALRKGDF